MRYELLIRMPKELEKEYMKCAICIESKMQNLPFENNRKQAKEILETVHSVDGNNGERYFLSFKDDYSKLAKVYCIKSKAEVNNCFEDYVNLVENITGKRVKNLRCNNGTEYMNSKIKQFAREKGIRILPYPPYVHELNGVAERFNKTIMNLANCVAKEARVNKRY